jgi:hypothetical protein
LLARARLARIARGVTKALVLSALAADPVVGRASESALDASLRVRGIDVHAVDVVAARIKPCQGCGSCGLRTPGRCVLGDDMQEIFPRIVESQVLVLASQVRFGTHGTPLKRVIDRFQPLMAPLYTIRDGEVKFRPRYDPRPAVLGVGLLPFAGSDPAAAAEASAYREVIVRNAANLAAPCHASAVLSASDAGPLMRSALDLALTALLGDGR